LLPKGPLGSQLGDYGKKTQKNCFIVGKEKFKNMLSLLMETDPHTKENQGGKKASKSLLHILTKASIGIQHETTLPMILLQLMTFTLLKIMIEIGTSFGLYKSLVQKWGIHYRAITNLRKFGALEGVILGRIVISQENNN
jgi:hypothetical protein